MVSCCWFSATAEVSGVTNGVVDVSAVPFKNAVAGGPAVTGFSAVEGVLAVARSAANPERVCTDLFFGAEIQTKHLVFCYLGFLPGFSLVFCGLPHPMHSPFKENQAFLFWRIFFLGFKNPSNCLVFLELFTC